MAATMFQMVGFTLGLLGVAGIGAATGMDQWATEDLFNSAVTAVFSSSGLGKSCVQKTSGFTECRPYFTVLGLPAGLQAVRALMIVGVILGLIGVLICIFALQCLKMGNMEENLRGSMSLTAGILFLLAGVCGISGVSAFANLIVRSFGFPAYFSAGLSCFLRYTLGPALFVGWAGAAGLMIGGLVACRGMAADNKQRSSLISKYMCIYIQLALIHIIL
uniref:Claudin-18-like n=1 Tax=Salarias fasciatus TaxID=181472 RepID=A0A672IS48_SALFA